MPPTLRWALNRLPIREEERKRLDRETFEAKAFVPTVERILVAVDGSPKGHFASRVAGLFAGARGTPVTVLNIGDNEPPDMDADATAPADAAAAKPNRAAQAVTSAAETIAADEENPANPVDVIERQHPVPADEAIATEARNGYDLLVIGVEHTAAPGGGFHENVSRLVRGFEGSIAIVVARGPHEADPEGSRLNILVPITGSEVSRRGAELAVVLAKAAKAPITALSVLSANAGSLRDRLGTARRDAAEVVKEIKMLADFNEQSIRTAIRTDISPEDAILRQARMGKHDLIVMGVSRRPGDRLSFGKVANALLDSSERSIMFVAPQVGATPPKGPPA
jgi:nucleotide-binding universal stress UspA family protein